MLCQYGSGHAQVACRLMVQRIPVCLGCRPSCITVRGCPPSAANAASLSPEEIIHPDAYIPIFFRLVLSLVSVPGRQATVSVWQALASAWLTFVSGRWFLVRLPQRQFLQQVHSPRLSPLSLLWSTPRSIPCLLSATSISALNCALTRSRTSRGFGAGEARSE